MVHFTWLRRGLIASGQEFWKVLSPLAGLFALTLVPMLGKQKELSQSEENHPKGPGEQVTGNEASDQRHGVPVAHVI